MYVRLAFSVAAHMEPDILIIDEVLAVGDARVSRKKCLGKMDEVSKKGAHCFVCESQHERYRTVIQPRRTVGKRKLIKDSYDVGSVVREYVYGNGGDSLANEWVNTRGEHKNNYFIPSRLVLVDNSGKKIGMPVRMIQIYGFQVKVKSKPDSSLILGYAIF